MPDPKANQTDSTFVFEVVERVHDRVLAGIDTLDNVLIAITAAVTAIAALVIDQVDELGRFALWLLLTSLTLCGAGWLWGRRNGGAYSEVPDVPTFIARVAERREDALVDSIEDFRVAIDRNRRVRTMKGLLAWSAVVTLVFSTYEASSEKVVHSHHEAARSRAAITAPAARPPDRTRGRPPAYAGGPESANGSL